ncbi:MAG: hypothetical protein IJA61_00315 [Clostridia bacterium]|nr:hypothetical protein [Clostridia bacterium]
MEEIKLNYDLNEGSNKNNSKGNWSGVFGFLVLFIIVVVVVVGISVGDGSINSNYLTYSNYTQIQNGMSYSQVVDILDGHQGVLDTSSSYGGYTLSYYTWSNNSGTKCIVVGFENGSVCAKSQYGLG